MTSLFPVSFYPLLSFISLSKLFDHFHLSVRAEGTFSSISSFKFALMEKIPETPPRVPVLSESTNLECKATPELKQQTDGNSRNPSNELRKPTTPDALKVPKAFKYSERYRSPTDMMVSPITRGLLARARRGGALLPPSMDQLKIHDMLVQDNALFP